MNSPHPWQDGSLRVPRQKNRANPNMSTLCHLFIRRAEQLLSFTNKIYQKLLHNLLTTKHSSGKCENKFKFPGQYNMFFLNIDCREKTSFHHGISNFFIVSQVDCIGWIILLLIPYLDKHNLFNRKLKIKYIYFLLGIQCKSRRVKQKI